MKKIKKSNENISIIRLSKNYGQHNATMCGFEFCNGDYILTMDDDLQHPPEEIKKLVAKIDEGFDVVISQFENKKHSFIKIQHEILQMHLSVRFWIT